jgi:hypothetical protein
VKEEHYVCSLLLFLHSPWDTDEHRLIKERRKNLIGIPPAKKPSEDLIVGGSALSAAGLSRDFGAGTSAGGFSLSSSTAEGLNMVMWSYLRNDQLSPLFFL